MKRTYECGSIAWPGVAGGADSLLLTGIPDGIGADSYRVAALQLMLRIVFNTAETTGSLDGVEIPDFLKKIHLKSMGKQLCNIGGGNLFDFIQYSALEVLSIPADAADNLTAEVRILRLYIPFEGKKSAEAQDFVLPAAALNDGVLKIDFEDATTIGTDCTITDATVYVSALLERKEEVQVPALPDITDGNIKLDNGHLPEGSYDVLFLKAPSDSFAAADIDDVQLVAAGEDIHDSVDPDVVVGWWAWDCSLPPGGFISTAAGDGDWENSAADYNIFPLIWPASNESSNRITQMVDTRGTDLVFKISGDLDKCEYVCRRYRVIDTDAKRKMLNKMGVKKPSAVRLKLKTKSKKAFSEVDGAKHMLRYGARQLPQKVIGASGDSVVNLGELNIRLGVR